MMEHPGAPRPRRRPVVSGVLDDKGLVWHGLPPGHGLIGPRGGGGDHRSGCHCGWTTHARSRNEALALFDRHIRAVRQAGPSRRGPRRPR
jgi:hypothetical protein